MTKKMRKNPEHTEETSKYENPLLLYLREIKKIPLLSKEEEEETAKLAVQGNKAARDKLVNANLRFVIMVAKKYRGNGLAFEDLVCEGNLGLLNAIKYYDAGKGYRFITYAVWWIRQAMIKAIYEKGRTIRLPNNKANELTKIERARQILQNQPGWNKDDEISEIAFFLDMPPEKAENLMRISHDVLSIDEPISRHGDAVTFKDHIEDEYSLSPVEYAMNSAMKDDLDKVIDGLGKKEADIIRCRYGLGGKAPLTLKEVGARHNISRERVRQIENRALGELQHSKGSKILANYIA